jgi:hypothetical protein
MKAWVGAPLILVAGVSAWLSLRTRVSVDAGQPRRGAIEAPRTAPASSSTHSATFTTHSPAPTPKELSSTDRKVFFDEIETVFGTLVLGGLSPAALQERLAKLNALGAAGLSAVVSELEAPAREDSQVRRRLFLVDYLAYRMRWDERAKDEALRLASATIPSTIPARYRATTLAEQSELIEAFVRTDWDAGTTLIREARSPQLKRLGALAAYEHLLNTGLSQADAAAKVRAVDPTFKI